MNLKNKVLKTAVGFTIFELILTMVIISIMAVICAPLLGVSADAIYIKMQQANINELAQLTHAKMSRDLRRLRNIQSIQTATSTQFVFIDKSNNTQSYQFTEDLLRYGYNSSGFQTLANNLQTGSSSFTYYDQNENVIGTPTVGLGTNSNIRKIQIRMVFLVNGQAYPVQTQIRFRNISGGAP